MYVKASQLHAQKPPAPHQRRSVFNLLSLPCGIDILLFVGACEDDGYIYGYDYAKSKRLADTHNIISTSCIAKKTF